MHSHITGHAIATFTIIVWGITFISTKVLLESLLPIEILFTRFALGFIAMFIVMPRLLGFCGIKRELVFAIAGLFGVTLYFLLENIALTYSYASNVGVIITVSPFFTALINHLFIKDEKLHLHFFVGFVISIVGICLMSFNSNEINFNPIGDLLAVLAALSWSVYSIFVKKACSFGYSNLLVTRAIFGYGLIFMIPAMIIMGFSFDTVRYFDAINIANLMFLGLVASALCFFSWNVAVKILGVIRTSAYIYAVPVVTVVAAILILDEKITPLSALGIFMTLLGLFISESYAQLKLIAKKLFRAKRSDLVSNT